MYSSILHLDLDTFFVSVERLRDSRLKDRPILVGGLGNRGVVAACSYETRRFGVHSGMAMRVARRLCPEATVIKGDAATYTRYSHLVTAIIKEQVPVFEKASIDEFYVDLTGMDRFFGSYQFSGVLRQKIIKESGLPISFGLSQNKIVSKIATGEAKPNNQKYIKAGLEKAFLAPLSVRKIPQVGGKTYQTLNHLGVQYIHTLQQMPVALVQRVLGKRGKTIWLRANGIDPSPIIPFHQRKSMSMERTFQQDTIAVKKLETCLRAMTESLAFQLRQEKKLTASLRVKIRYADYKTATKQAKIAYTSADHILLPKVLQLFRQLYQRRMLIRLVGIRFSELVGGHYQINLFDDSEKMIALYQSMDHLKKRYGEKSVSRAASLGIKSIKRAKKPFPDDCSTA